MWRLRKRWVLGACSLVLLVGACWVWAAGISSVPIPLIVRTVDGTVSGVFRVLRVTNGTLTNEGGGVGTISVGSGVGNGDMTGPALSVDGEVVVYDGVSGKVVKRAAGTGVAILTNGVLGLGTPGVEYVAPAGNVATATALAANPANCAAGTFPLGILASGAAETCTALPTTITGTLDQIVASAATGSITLSIANSPTLIGTTTGTFRGPLLGNASTATALSGNPGNCAVGQAARGITAEGVGEDCFAVQLPLGYTAENVDNKSSDPALTAGGGFYPTVPAVKGYVDAAVAGVSSIWGNIGGDIPNQFDLNTALNDRELLSNKSIDGTLGGATPSNTKYPSEQAVKTYVDTTVIGAGLGDVLSVGNCASGACLDGTSDGGTYVALYDGNSHKVTVQPADVTADRVQMLPDESGTVCTTGSICTGYQASLGYTAENITNKYSNADLAGGGGTYPTTPSVKSYVDTGLATKQATMDATAVVALFNTGTCTGYLKSDETCDVPPGGVNDPGGNGMMARTALNTTVARTITGTANEIEVSQGDGQAGNPTLGIPNSAQLHVAKLTNLTSNGPVVTSGGDGTLGVSAQVLTQSGLTWNVTAATCTGDANGGTLTVNVSNEIVCLGDDGGGGGTAFSAITTAENTTATMTVGTGASIVLNGGTVEANKVVAGGAGVLKVNASNVPSPAGAADVVAIFGGGTCTGYLKSDGSCDAGTSSPDAVSAAVAFTTAGRLLTVEAAGRGVVESATALTDVALLAGGGQQMSNTRHVRRRVQIDTSQSPAVVAGPATADVVYHHTFPGVGTPPITFGKPGGVGFTPEPNDLLTFEILSAAPVAVSWNAIYAGSAGLALPTTTIENVYNVWMFSYNSTLSQWMLIAVAPSTESFTPGTLQMSDNDTSGAYSALVVPDGALTAVGGTATLTALIPNPPSGQTMQNTRVVRRVQEDTTAATVEPNCTSYDAVTMTALAEDISFSVPNCTPTDDQYLVIALANAAPDTTHAVAWDTGANGYSPLSGIDLPVVTIANKVLTLQYRWNASLSKWVLVGTTPTSSALTNPMSAAGDLIVGGIAGAVTRLATPPAAGLLTSDGAGSTAWSTAAASKTLLAISCGDLTDEQTGCNTDVSTMVTAAGTLTANQLVLGAGTKTTTVQGGLGTNVQVLHGNAGGAPTWGAVDLAADVTGDLPLANLAQASAESKLLGRGEGGGAPGDFQEISLGTGLSMTGTTLSSTGPPGGSVGQVQWNNTSLAGSSAMSFDADDLLTMAPRITTANVSAQLTTTSGPIVACTAGASDITLTLPAGTATTQRWWVIIKVDAGAGACLIDADGSETINGSTNTASAATQWSRVDLNLSQTGGIPNWSAVFGKTFIDLAADVGSTILPMANGGLGVGTLTDHAVLVGNAAATPTQVAATANGQCFMSHPSDYANNDPSFQTCPATTGTPINNQLAVWTSGAAIEGDAALTFDTTTNTLNLGAAGNATGHLNLLGTTSGVITIQSQDAAGTYNFNLPNAAGSSGQVLTSAGGGASPMTWSTPVTATSSDTLTNKTIDAEGTGNALTLVSKLWLPAATCQNTTATLNWDTRTTQIPAAACATSHGVADFATDSGILSLHTTLLLPDDWTGVLGAKVLWLSAATANDVAWQLETLCVADDEADSITFSNTTEIADTAKGTTNALNTTAITTITTTGCAAGELMHLQIRRDPADAQDTFAAGTTARLYGVELTLRRQQ